jgi:hypothetical protein
MATADDSPGSPAEFAEAYADQNERDYESLRKAVGEGRVEATPEPA